MGIYDIYDIYGRFSPIHFDTTSLYPIFTTLLLYLHIKHILTDRYDINLTSYVTILTGLDCQNDNPWPDKIPVNSGTVEAVVGGIVKSR